MLVYSIFNFSHFYHNLLTVSRHCYIYRNERSFIDEMTNFVHTAFGSNDTKMFQKAEVIEFLHTW